MGLHQPKRPSGPHNRHRKARKALGPYIGHNALKLAIYLVKGSLQWVFIGYDDYPEIHAAEHRDGSLGLREWGPTAF